MHSQHGGLTKQDFLKIKNFVIITILIFIPVKKL